MRQEPSQSGDEKSENERMCVVDFTLREKYVAGLSILASKMSYDGRVC